MSQLISTILSNGIIARFDELKKRSYETQARFDSCVKFDRLEISMAQCVKEKLAVEELENADKNKKWETHFLHLEKSFDEQQEAIHEISEKLESMEKANIARFDKLEMIIAQLLKDKLVEGVHKNEISSISASPTPFAKETVEVRPITPVGLFRGTVMKPLENDDDLKIKVKMKDKCDKLEDKDWRTKERQTVISVKRMRELDEKLFLNICKQRVFAVKLFDEMPEKIGVSWSAMLVTKQTMEVEILELKSKLINRILENQLVKEEQAEKGGHETLSFITAGNDGIIELVNTQIYAPTTLTAARDFWMLRYCTTQDERSLVVCERLLTSANGSLYLSFLRAKILSSGFLIRLCEGNESLDLILAMKDSHYSEKDAAVVVRQMLKVAAEFHLCGLVQRDMKPENFLFKSTEEDSPLQATCFGLSDFIKCELKHNSRPESDVWSIGVISFILLCVRQPFWDKTEDNIFKEVLKDKLDFRRKPWPMISNSAKKIVKKLLVNDSGARLTAAQELSHQWVREGGDASKIPIDISILNNMRQFVRFSRLKQFALRALVITLDEEELADLIQFDAIDVDKNGAISLDEMRQALAKDHPWKLKDAQVAETLQVIDSNADRFLDFTEFVAATLHVNQLEEHELEKWQLRSRATFEIFGNSKMKKKNNLNYKISSKFYKMENGIVVAQKKKKIRSGDELHLEDKVSLSRANINRLGRLRVLMIKRQRSGRIVRRVEQAKEIMKMDDDKPKNRRTCQCLVTHHETPSRVVSVMVRFKQRLRVSKVEVERKEKHELQVATSQICVLILLNKLDRLNDNKCEPFYLWDLGWLTLTVKTLDSLLSLERATMIYFFHLEDKVVLQRVSIDKVGKKNKSG